MKRRPKTDHCDGGQSEDDEACVVTGEVTGATASVLERGRDRLSSSREVRIGEEERRPEEVLQRPDEAENEEVHDRRTTKAGRRRSRRSEMPRAIETRCFHERVVDVPSVVAQ